MPTGTLLAPLSGVELPEPVQLAPGVEIHRLSPAFDSILADAAERKLIRHPANHKYCLVVRNADLVLADASDAKAIIEEVVLRLRIYKAGDVGFNFAAVDPTGWYDQLERLANDGQSRLSISYGMLAVFFYVVWDRPGLSQPYTLAPDDIPPLQALFEQTTGRKLLERTAFRYFFRAYHEPYATDRFLSNVIALENLLLGDSDERSSLMYKFADRGTFLVHQADPELCNPDGVFGDLQDIYRARSAIVHRGEWPNDDVPIKYLRNSEAYLRMLLDYVVRNRDMEKAKNIDAAKRRLYPTWRPPTVSEAASKSQWGGE